MKKKTLYLVSDDNQVFPRLQSTGNMSWKRICMHAAAVWIVINCAKIKHSEHTMKVHVRLFHLHDSFLYDKDNPKLINATGHDWIISCKFINIIIISLSISRVVTRNILYWTNHIVVDVDEEAKRAFSEAIFDTVTTWLAIILQLMQSNNKKCTTLASFSGLKPFFSNFVF